MNKSILCSALAACFLLPAAEAQIPVPAGGSGTLFFAAQPPAAQWSTRSITGNDSAFITAAALDAAVVTNVASSITAQVINGGAANPPTQNALAQWSSGGSTYLLTRPTSVGATLLMATLRNDTGADANTLDINYTLAQGGTALSEQVPAHQVYYSLTGAANSWALIPELSGGTAGPRSHVVYLSGTWLADAVMYLLWADDNTPNGTDQAQEIDDISFVANYIALPLTVTLTAPPDGQLIVAPDNMTNLTVSAISGGTTPANSVSFFTNGVLFTTVSTPPFTAQLIDLAAGTYAIHAEAENGGEFAVSATHTIKIREQFRNYTGGTYFEDFNVMGATGRETPVGWYVGSDASATTPAPGVNATVGDGSAAADQSLHAWNYGLTDDPDRSLGSCPSASDRNTVLRLRNNSSSNLLSFDIRYDGEVWRVNTNTVEWLTNYVSFNRGGSWIATGFNFQQPIPPMNPAAAVNGHDPANRTANIGGSVTAPQPVPPGGIIYIRWHNLNDAPPDAALAIENFSFTGTAFSDASAISLTVSSPTNGQTFSGACGSGANITVNATASPFVTNVAFRLDGGAAINDFTTPFSAVLPGVPAGPHTISVTAMDSFGVSSNINVSVTVLANQPPLVSFTNTFSGANTGLVFLVGTPVTNQFSASDSEGLASLEFLVNDLVIFSTNTAYGQLVVNNALAGNSTYTVRATDTCGAVSQASRTVTVTNPPAATTSIIISNGSDWKFYSANGAPAPIDSAEWFQTFHDDSLWSSGFAELGSGDAVNPPNTVPERTTIYIGPNGAPYRAAYFRKVFTVADPSRYTGLTVRSLHDDGCAVYLNDVLVAAFNMNNTVGVPIAYTDLAAANIGHDGTVYSVSNIANTLSSQVNCLAVEIHQNSTTSSDLSFDLMLWGTVPPGPTLAITTDGSSYTITWDDPLLEYKLQQNGDPGSPLNWTDTPGDPSSPYVQSLPASPSHLFFRLMRR